MALRVPGPAVLFEWLHAHDVPYVTLRDEDDDLDLLLDDDAVPALRRAFAQRRGLKVDLYGLRGEHGTAYHGLPHLPVALGTRLLAGRRPVDGRLRARADDERLAWLYHLAYHKPVQSGLPFTVCEQDPAGLEPRCAPLEALCAQLGQPMPRSLLAAHRQLEAAGFGLDDARLHAYLRHDFAHQRKSMLHAWLAAQRAGELNLFVIRGVAVRHGLGAALLQRLHDSFEVLAVKPIPLWSRLTRARHMRGGKWRRGGPPHLAVVVFDPTPEPSSPEERLVHPFVFNRRQFIKQAWRQWFSETSGARPRDNPIHSTDNEAEAIGHLPLFFDGVEQADILQRLAARRARLGGHAA